MATKWTEEEIRIALTGGVPVGRSKSSARRVLAEIGAIKRRKPRPNWKPDHLELLARMRDGGMSAEQIHRSGSLPQSLNAIQKKLGRMGLTQRLQILKFNGYQREQFRLFLKKHWEGKTPQDLTDLWNERNPRLKVNKRRTISYLMQMEIKIPYGEVQKINHMRRKAAAAIVSGSSPQQIADSIRNSRAELMRRRLELGRDLWTGAPLALGVLEECDSVD